MDNKYNDIQYAKSITGKKVHVTTGCIKLDVIGIIKDVVNLQGEVLYLLILDSGSTISVGAKSPGLNMDFVE